MYLLAVPIHEPAFFNIIGKSLGPSTTIAIVVILVVLLFGRGKISSLMGDVAKGIKSFKKGMASDVTDESEPKNISDDNKDSNNKD